MSLSMKKALLDCGCGCFSTSDSASDTEPPITNNCSLTNCISNVFAARYKVTFAWNPTALCGPLYALQTYTVIYRPPPITKNQLCVFGTDLQAINRVGAACNLSGGYRVSMYFSNNNIGPPNPPGTLKRYSVSISCLENGTSTAVGYDSNLTNVGVGAPSPTPIDCLAPFTLNKFTGAGASGAFEHAVTGVNSFGATLPATVYVEPA